jgi:UDP-N-acetylmuramate dehydrogenase
MYILENVPLKSYSTMRLGGTAAFLTEVNTKQDIVEATTWAAERGLPVILIGEGSNIIWDDDGYPGLVLVNKLLGVEVSGDYDSGIYLTAASGENWDKFVAKTVEMGLTGIEFLSLIPGTVGATPVQNVGAYGAEVSSTLTTIEAYDLAEKKFLNIRGSECNFGYRTSRFKTTDHGRFLITSVTYFLQKGNPRPPFYAALQNYLTQNNVTDITPNAVREAVIAIRSSKLPDPKVVANNGSFFANPIIDPADFTQLLADHPDIPHWAMDDGRIKISAAWLIEQTGFKDYHDAETGMGTWPKQPLVLVNESAQTTAQLKVFRQKILDAVQAKFNIALVQEPELI